MADINSQSSSGLKYKPFIPSDQKMPEFTLIAVVVGLLMSVILGAANAYLGLRAGMTIAATYPAAVIGMAVLRITKSNILEENMARTIGSIGESIAAGAIFTIPAFMIANVWTNFSTDYYFEAFIIMFVGGTAGILFVTLLRRVMVEDADLPFPESVAASEIHKSGRSGGTGAKFLFSAMAFGALVKILSYLQLFSDNWSSFVAFSRDSLVKFASKSRETLVTISGGGGMLLTAPEVSPAYIGVGYIIGPRLAALNFSGGLLAWGLFVPLLLFFLGPSYLVSLAIPKFTIAWNDACSFAFLNPDYIASLSTLGVNSINWENLCSFNFLSPEYYKHFSSFAASTSYSWDEMSMHVWKYIVRPIAIGGMLISAAFTLYKMRQSLLTGLGRAIGDIKKATSKGMEVNRVEQDLSFKVVFLGIVAVTIAIFFVYLYFSQSTSIAVVATLVMIVAGFFFAAVSGYLVGMIGSSNNPISGLTLSTLIVAALLVVLVGVPDNPKLGIAAILGVAAVICVAAAVAGEMLQDLKVGHILGGTPWKMQVGDLIGILIASAVMFFPILVLHQGDINMGGTGLGGINLPAPQAGLMAMLSEGIVGGDMAWPLVIVGMLMAVGLILVQVRSPMLVSVGMYLPLQTTFAIFVGGMIRGICDRIAQKKKFNQTQNTKTENIGTLIASGLIAGEALIGLVFAALAFFSIELFKILPDSNYLYLISIGVLAIIGWVLIYFPIKNSGKPDDPPAPTISM